MTNDSKAFSQELLGSAGGDVQAAVDAGLNAHLPHMLEPGGVYALAVPAGGHVEQLDLDLDKYRDRPRRKTGTTYVRDHDSFTEYFRKHADESTEIYASVDHNRVLAVLDAHEPGMPRWGEHKLLLQLRHSEPWSDWTGSNGKKMGQAEFAEWIEDHLADIREPSSAELLEIAQTFQATTKVNFQSGVRLSSGQRKLSYVEDVDAKAGQKGELTIPASFSLGLEVFEGSGVADTLTARLRYRINGGDLVLSYHLDRPNDVKRAAFQSVVTDLSADLDRPIMAGASMERA